MKTILPLLILASLVLVASAQPEPIPPPPPMPTPTNEVAPASSPGLPAFPSPPQRRNAITTAPVTPQSPATTPGQPAVRPATPPATPAPATPLTTTPPPAANPGAPAPANSTPANAPASAPAINPDDELIPAGTVDWVGSGGADLEQVFQFYEELTKRSILRPTTLKSEPIKFRVQSNLTRKELVQALNSVLALNNIAMIPVGEKFVKAVPKAQAAQEGGAIQRLGSEPMPELGPFVTHTVKLEYAKPSELGQLLAMFASQGAANPVVPIDSSMTIVLRDNTENVKRMVELIKEVDTAIPAEFISEVIPIKYAMAADIASALGSLSSGGAVTSAGSSGRTGGTTGRTGTTGSSRFGLGAMQTGQQNNPLGTTQQGQLGQAGNQPSFQQRLQDIVKKASTTGSGDVQVLGPTKIIADERANALLVFASKTDMSIITNIVAKLDVVLPQVLIESVIMDVQLNDGYSFGVSYLQHPQQSGNFTGFGGVNNLNAFTSPDFGSFTNMTKGFNYFGRFGSDLDVVVNASANDSRVTVVQKPRIMTFHAKPASFFIGNTVPYVTSTYYSGYGYGGYPSSQYQQLKVGIQLDVTPYINQDGLVVMEINQQIEEISGSTAIANVGDVPNTASRSLSAQVAVKDRETIILGGFIRSGDDKAKSGVPYLKDIPLLGFLFNKTSHTSERKELLVLMRPTVLRTPELAAAHTAAEKLRLPGVSEAEAMDNATEEKNVERMKRRIGNKDNGQYLDVSPSWKPTSDSLNPPTSF